jgi:hypothetical protein
MQIIAHEKLASLLSFRNNIPTGFYKEQEIITGVLYFPDFRFKFVSPECESEL